MTKFHYPYIITIVLIITTIVGVSGCSESMPVTEEISTATVEPSVPVPTPSKIVIHPELEIITPNNIGRLEQIDQWGYGNVYGVALSPDGDTIAVATATGIYLYNRKTINQIDYIDVQIGSDIEFETQACSPSGILAFSPDSSILAIANTDITLLDLKTRTIQTVIKNKIEDVDSIITSIQFSLDGGQILGIQKRASGYPCYSGWGSLVIYTVETGKMVFRHDYSRYEEGPSPIFTERDGIILISYLDTQKKGYSVLEVNLQTGKIKTERPSPTIYSMNSKAAVANKWIGIGEGGDGYSEAHIIDLTSFEDIEVLNANVKLIPQSNRMIVHEQQKLTVRTLEGMVTCSKPIGAEATDAFLPDIFSLDGSIAISWNSYGYRAGDIRVWDLEQCTISDPVLIFPEVARHMSISSDGRSVLTGSMAGYTFHVFDTQTGKMRFSLSGFDAQFSADGKQVFVVEEKYVNAYDVDVGEFLYPVLEADTNYMSTIVVSPNGKILAIDDNGSEGYQFVSIDNTSSADKILTNKEFPFFSKDGKYVASIYTALASSEIRFWELNTGNELTQWRGSLPSEGYVKPSFSSDFSQLASFGTDGYYKYVYIWDIPEFSLVHALTQPFQNSSRYISSLIFVSNDELLLALGSNPDAFLFWDIQTGNLLYEIPVNIHESELGNPVVFSPNGRLLLVLDNDGTIHVFGIK